MSILGALVITMFSWTNQTRFDNGRNCDSVTIVSRAEWGARAPKQPPIHIGHPVNMSFIHHSDSPWYCQDQESCIKQVRSIQNFHMDTRGWNDIGYSFLIGGDGRVYEGRGWDILGSHTYGYNYVSLGFCIIGDYTSRLPTDVAISATKAILRCGVEKDHIIQSYELFGHRDGVCTNCPGNALYKLIQTWPHFSKRKIPIHCREDD